MTAFASVTIVCDARLCEREYTGGSSLLRVRQLAEREGWRTDDSAIEDGGSRRDFCAEHA